MRSKPTVKCPARLVGTPNQVIKIKRGGQGKISGSGPSGYKTRPARLLSRSLADMASQYRHRKAPTKALKQKEVT